MKIAYRRTAQVIQRRRQTEESRRKRTSSPGKKRPLSKLKQRDPTSVDRRTALGHFDLPLARRQRTSRSLCAGYSGVDTKIHRSENQSEACQDDVPPSDNAICERAGKRFGRRTGRQVDRDAQQTLLGPLLGWNGVNAEMELASRGTQHGRPRRAGNHPVSRLLTGRCTARFAWSQRGAHMSIAGKLAGYSPPRCTRNNASPVTRTRLSRTNGITRLERSSWGDQGGRCVRSLIGHRAKAIAVQTATARE